MCRVVLLEMMRSARVATHQISDHSIEHLEPSKHRPSQSLTDVAPVDRISLLISGPARFKSGANICSHWSKLSSAKGKGAKRCDNHCSALEGAHDIFRRLHLLPRPSSTEQREWLQEKGKWASLKADLPLGENP